MILSPALADQLRERFAASLDQKVELKLYIRPGSGRLILPNGMGCPTCDDARKLAEEVAETAPEHLEVAIVDITEAEVPTFVEDVPTFTVGRPGEDPRIRFQGVTAGLEFATLVDAIERVSTGDTALSAETKEALEALDRDAEVMVFTTPTCRYCPGAVSMANRLALANDHITAVTVAANDFPALSRRFGVQGVPQTVVNRQGVFVGALPEPQFVEAVLELAGVKQESEPADS